MSLNAVFSINILETFHIKEPGNQDRVWGVLINFDMLMYILLYEIRRIDRAVVVERSSASYLIAFYAHAQGQGFKTRSFQKRFFFFVSRV